MAIIYRAIATGEEGLAEHLEVRGREVAILHHMQGSLQIQQDDMLEAGVASQGCARWCVIRLLAMREAAA